MIRPRSSRLRGLPFNRLIPNILTVLALCAGLTAIRFGLQGKWELAANYRGMAWEYSRQINADTAKVAAAALDKAPQYIIDRQQRTVETHKALQQIQKTAWPEALKSTLQVLEP